MRRSEHKIDTASRGAVDPRRSDFARPLASRPAPDWTDDEIEQFASSDPDHPALDDQFWRQAEEQLYSVRSQQPIELPDLRRLASLAIAQLDEFARRNPEGSSGAARSSLKLLALAQGAAQHLVDGQHGIKDFDVWAFFEAGRAPAFPHRPVWHLDYGPSRFGSDPMDADRGYRGRRVDLMGRSIPFGPAGDPVAAVRTWLRTARAASACHLARRPVVALYPEALVGTVVWKGTKAEE